MNFEFDTLHRDFQREVREVIAQDLPVEMRDREHVQLSLASDPHDQRRWLNILSKRGWSVPHWPVEHGGLGWTPLQKFIFEDELHLADAPQFPWPATHMVGPVIAAFGSPEMQERFLPDIRTGRTLWAQGFSEPSAGSDLVALRTRAVRDGDHYVVNGQKIWTSGAHHAEWGFFLVKTDVDVKPQHGISFLLIELSSPGVTIRPIPQINGEAHLCEVFLDDVRVPADQIVGEAGRGWSYAKFLLDHERTASSFIYWNKRELRRTKRLADSIVRDGAPIGDRPEVRYRLARLEAELTALEWSVLRVLANEATTAHSTAVASVLKISGARLQQSITECQIDLLGERANRFYSIDEPVPAPTPLWPDEVAGRTSIALMTRAATIFGGSEQIQKNILAKLAFQL